MTRRIRPARADDARAIRRLVTQALLAAGFPPPDAERDRDLIDLLPYEQPGNGMWVAEAENGEVHGCVALRSSEQGLASLARLAGESLPELVAVAITRAEELGVTVVEVVIPPGADDIRSTAVAHGFAPADEADGMLYRRVLGRTSD